MRKLLLGMIILICFPFHSIAQESIGFSDPDNIQPLLDYRLPEWGYTNLFWDFSLNGNLDNRQSDEGQNSAINNQLSAQLVPNYIRYRESETRISSYSFSPLFEYSFTDQSSFNDNEQYNSDSQLAFFWNFNEKLYLNESDLFFTGIFSGIFRQIKNREEQQFQGKINIDETRLNRDFNPSLSIGIGYGRLRNVNPVIRSLRMNERLNTLDTGQALSQNDITEAAGHFTRLNGYREMYDRHQKQFWGDMDGLLSADLAALDAFDLLYLTDVTQETIGSRREGWEISAIATIQHFVGYIREENELTNDSDSRTSKNTYLVPSVSGSWYKNLSLKHQIGINGEFQYRKELSDNSFSITENLLISSGNWLYTITDRILINTTVGYTRFGRESHASNAFSAGLDANYFLENRFSLFCDLRYIYQTNSGVGFSSGTITSSVDRSSLIFDVGLRYYMKRGLF